MKTRGFTLIELLGVVIILGILSLISFPMILNQIKNAKEGIKDSTKALIIDSAKDYYEENINNYEKIEGITYCIDIKTLTDENYLNKNLKNENLNNIDTSKKIKLLYHNNKFEYNITDTCNNKSLTRNNIEVPIVTEDSGLYKSTTDKDRFIYRGGTPDNWIELNEGTDENPDYIKYRIISFENDGTIKVVRNERLSIDRAFDEGDSIDQTAGPRHNVDNTFCNYSGTYYGCNVWGNMNNTYYNGQTLNPVFKYRSYHNKLTETLQENANTGTVNTDSTLNQYLNGTWLTSALSNYIDSHNFNTGGVYYYNDYADGDKGITREKKEEQVYSWNGKVGLLNIIDYVESSTNSSCTDVWSNYHYNPNNENNKTSNEWPCKYDNYNYKSEYHQWSLSPYSYSRYGVWYVSMLGYFGDSSAYYANGVRPAFYLKSSISLTGEGTEESPYRIVGEI